MAFHTAFRDVPAQGAKGIDTDTGAVVARVVVDEIVLVEVVVHAVDRALVQRGGGVAFEAGDQHVGGTVITLAVVQVHQVFVHRSDGCDDALFTERVQVVEVIDQPARPVAIRLETPGDHAEMAAVGFIVIPLGAVEHEPDHGFSRRLSCCPPGAFP